ncbi:MAG: hypothetical protein WA964_20620 [Ilumatobacter sp.]|uniref:hypothetical protein n=1 Tax=Ilumatobacter sp. TaxID=1967498 RepID=UPI003C758A47
MTVDPATDAADVEDPSPDAVSSDRETGPADSAADGDGDDSDDSDEPGIWGRIDWLAVGVLFLVSSTLVGLHVRAYTTLSPIDELQHIDYVIKAGDFEPPHVNDLVGFDAMAEAACRSVDAPGYIGPLCGLDEYDPEDFQENGVNTSAGQFPFYYTATGVVSRMIVGAGVLESQVTAARMVGALWAGAAWSVMWYVLALLRIPRRRRAVALAALIATPFTLFHAATVNADGVLMLTGAVAVLATMKFEARRLNGWLLLVAYAALYFVEPTNALVIVPCVAYLAVRVSWRSDASAIRRLLPLIAVPMVVLFRLRFAKSLQRLLFPASPRTNIPTANTDNAAPDGVVWDKVLAQIDTLFTPVNYAFVPDFLASQRTAAMQEVVNWLLIGAMFAVAIGAGVVRTVDGPSPDEGPEDDAVRSSDEAMGVDEVMVADERARWLTRIGIVALIAAGPFYTFSFAYFSNADFPSQARFALPLVVFMVVGLAAALTTRWAMAIASTVVVLASANLLWLLLTP